jgi:dinuclear metal center YbgI/SA1388 family protein
LDINDAVINEAIEKKADLIITHHPFIFKAVKNVTDDTALGKRIIKLIRNNIAVFSAHTNLDSALGGTNATLAELFDLTEVEGLADVNEDGTAMGRIGNLKRELTFGELIQTAKKILGAEYLSVCGDTSRVVKRLGICTGKGSSFMSLARSMGADAYITGDFGYHEGQTAQDLDLCVIDGTHYLTEVIVVPVLCSYLRGQFADLEVVESEVNGQTLAIV